MNIEKKGGSNFGEDFSFPETKINNERQRREERLNKIREDLESVSDKLGEPIEKGIKETVAVFVANGFRTTQSCEGHGREEHQKGDMISKGILQIFLGCL